MIIDNDFLFLYVLCDIFHVLNEQTKKKAAAAATDVASCLNLNLENVNELILWKVHRETIKADRNEERKEEIC